MARKPKTATLNEFDHFKFAPMRQAQAEAAHDFRNGKNLLLSGYAGTGKTHLAISLAIEALQRGEAKTISIFRSAVPTRDVGFLPGTEEEKMMVYEKAIKKLFSKICKNDTAYGTLKLKGIVGFGSTSFERGVTYDDTVMIIDEVQNLTYEEINTLVTRLGDTSRVIISGDFRQSDVQDSGFRKAVAIIRRLQTRFSHIDFTIDDIVRGGLVKDWIIAAEEVNHKHVESDFQD